MYPLASAIKSIMVHSVSQVLIDWPMVEKLESLFCVRRYLKQADVSDYPYSVFAVS